MIKIDFLRRAGALIFLLFLPFSIFGQFPGNDNTAGTKSFTVPAGVTSVTAAVWGGGGGGGGSSSNGSGGNGGGGGGSASFTFDVLSGQTIDYTVGNGGAGGAAAGGRGANGSLSSITHGPSGTSLAGNGGGGGLGNNGAIAPIGSSSYGGSATGGANSPGSSGTRNTNNGGNGGNSGTSFAVFGTGGTGNSNSQGAGGGAPGGGGAGGEFSGGNRAGGAGGSGRVYLNYISVTGITPNPVCVGSTITITGTNFGTGVSTVSINGTACTAVTRTSPTTITAVVAAGTTSGVVQVTNPNGTNNGMSIIVNPSPSAIGGGAPTVCIGGTSPAFTNATAGGTWSVITGTGSGTISTSGVLTGTAAGTLTVRYTLPTGCFVNSGSVTVQQVPAVTGNPGNVTVNAGGNTSFTVVANNAPTNYTWQVSTDAGATWSTVTDGGVYSNATTATLNITGVNIGMNGYRYRAAASNSCGISAYSASALLSVNLVYCNPTGSLNCDLQDYIANVTLSTLNNTTLCNGVGYTNFPKTGNQTTTVVKSFTYPFSLTVGSGDGNHGAGVWIDFNQNGIFSDAGEFFLVSNAISPDSSTSINILIPAGAATGDVRMRVRYGYNINVNSGMSCAMGGTWGETEDYTITITNPAACNVPAAQPTSLVLTPNVTAINGSFTAASPAPNGYLVVANTTGIAPAPMNGTTYAIGSTALGGSNIVIDTDADTTFSAVGLTPLTTYYFFVYSMNNYCTGGPLYLTVSPLTGNAKTTYCIPTVQNPNALYIDKVAFVGTIADPPVNTAGGTGAGNNGYSDFTTLNQIAKQAQGEGINLLANSAGGTLARGRWKAWVDWNTNGIFEGSELVYTTEGFVGQAANFGFTIPANQVPGLYRIRLRVNNSASCNASTCTEQYGYDFGPCDSFTGVLAPFQTANFGETEDYLFEVIENCTAKISTITPASICHVAGGNQLTLKATSTTPVTGFRWYDSPTGSNFVSVPADGTGLSGTFVTPLISSSAIYYVTAYNGNCESTFRTPVLAEVKPTPELTFSPTAPEICGDTSIIAVSASGSKETVHLVREDFENGSLGVFSSVNLDSNNSATDIQTQFTNHASVYEPSGNVWFPAVSSGFGDNKFVLATSDVQPVPSAPVINALTLTDAVDATDLDNLTLKMRIYYSRYWSDNNNPNAQEEYVAIEVSSDGGVSYPNTIVKMITNQGQATNFATVTYDLSSFKGISSLKFRIRHYSWAGSGFLPDGIAIDDIELFGERALVPSFAWSSNNPIVFYSDPSATTVYTSGAPASVIYIKPTDSQLETYNGWNIMATATLINGCSASGNLSVANSNKIWNPATSTNWNSSSWLPAGVPPVNSHCVIIKKPVVLGVGADGFAKNITIKPGGSLQVNANKTLTVTEAITNTAGDGNFVVASDANLIQVNDAAVNTGAVTVKRDAYMKRQDYTYWGSPVAAQNLKAFSPNTLTSRFYVYNESNDEFGPADPAGNFVPGTGYAIRSPNNFPTDNLTYQTFNGIFKGVPNNGNFSFPLKLSGNGYNLIANPYPSNIDLQLLKDLNPTKINMLAYFWTNINVNPVMQGSGYPNGGYVSNYAVLNGTAGVPASYAVTPQNPNNGNLLVSKTPNQYIKTGQGFIVKSLVNNQDLVFNNSIRTPDQTSVFFNSRPERSLTVDRFWLQLTTPLQVVTTAAIGYKQGATNQFELDYDAPLMGLGSDAVFTSMDGTRLAIQGRQYPLNISDVVRLGTHHHVDGNYTLSMPLAEGIFANGQAVYLKDLQTGTVTNLSEDSYSFSAEKGLTEGRFEIVYQPETVLGTGGSTKDLLTVYRDGGEFVVKSGSRTVSSVEVYDTSGKLVTSIYPNQTEVRIKADAWVSGVYVLKIDEGGNITTKKVVK